MIVDMGSMVVRPNLLRQAGHYIDGHTHNFDHLTVVLRGALRVEVTRPDGSKGTRIVAAPLPGEEGHSLERASFNVPAQWKHKLVALTDDTEFWCLYPPRNEQGDIVDRTDPAMNYEWIAG